MFAWTNYAVCLLSGFSSCSRCMPFTGCQGCTIGDEKNEEFPVFPALLNAKHQRNISIRILTNSYNHKTCEGKITPLDWLLHQHNFHACQVHDDRQGEENFSAINKLFIHFIHVKQRGRCHPGVNV